LVFGKIGCVYGCLELNSNWKQVESIFNAPFEEHWLKFSGGFLWALFVIAQNFVGLLLIS